MELSENGFDQLVQAEGCKLKPYLDSAGIPTIGIGSTYYLDGRKVTMEDPPINIGQAKEIAINVFNKDFKKYLPENVNQNQFDALALFVYNIGPSSYLKSTLRKKVIVNPNDTSIKDEFLKWVYATVKGKKVKIDGLVNRRNREIELYFKK